MYSVLKGHSRLFEKLRPDAYGNQKFHKILGSNLFSSHIEENLVKFLNTKKEKVASIW